MSTQTTQTIEQFFARWATSNEELTASFRDSFADGAEWQAGPAPIPVTRGAEEARNLTGLLAHAPKRDRYGGIDTAGGFRGSGYFRTERRDGRWWLVTPDGNPFFSIGMDVVQPGGVTYVEGREFMFRDLPARDGELAAHWSERDDRRGLGAQRGRGFDHGHAFDFYRANLQRKFGADWQAHWREEHWHGSKLGASTQSAIGAKPNSARCVTSPIRCRYRRWASSRRSVPA